MRNLRKTYKILLFLALGFGVFFLFWNVNGRPGFTPIMAMRMLERSYLVNDTEVLLCEDGDNAIVNRRYKNIITADDQYLYYCELMGKTFLPWWEPGLWEPNMTLDSTPRGETVSFIPGSVQYRPYGDVRQQFSIPLYLIPEDDPAWDSVEASLTFDYRNSDDPAWNCAITYHNRTERNPDGVTILLFLDDRAEIDGTTPDERLSVITHSLWQRLYYFNRADNGAPITLTFTLYDGDTAVHSESHDLTEWR